MFGGELLVAFTQGKRLGGLHESARAFSVFLNIHLFLLGLLSPPKSGTAKNIQWSVQNGGSGGQRADPSGIRNR